MLGKTECVSLRSHTSTSPVARCMTPEVPAPLIDGMACAIQSSAYIYTAHRRQVEDEVVKRRVWDGEVLICNVVTGFC